MYHGERFKMLIPETIDEFFDRIYVNGVNGRVFVYPKKRGEGTKVEIWSIETMQNYLKWLSEHKPKTKMVID